MRWGDVEKWEGARTRGCVCVCELDGGGMGGGGGGSEEERVEALPTTLLVSCPRTGCVLTGQLVTVTGLTRTPSW